MSENTQGKDNKSGSRRGLFIGLVGGAVLIIVLVVVVILNLGKGKNDTSEAQPEPNKKAVITADNVEEVVEDLVQTEEDVHIPQSYTVSQNSEWHFPDGNSKSTDAFVENVSYNETPVYFDVIIDDTEEVVYSSPIIELGASLSGFKLDKPLDAGTYTCTLEYHLVDDDQNTLTTVLIGATLIIEN